MRRAVAGSSVARCGIGRELREADGARASRIQAGGPALSRMGEASYPSLRGYTVTSAGCARSAPKTSGFSRRSDRLDVAANAHPRLPVRAPEVPKQEQRSRGRSADNGERSSRSREPSRPVLRGDSPVWWAGLGLLRVTRRSPGVSRQRSGAP